MQANHEEIPKDSPPRSTQPNQDSASTQIEILPVSSILNNGNKGAEKGIIRRGKIFTQILTVRNRTQEVALKGRKPGSLTLIRPGKLGQPPGEKRKKKN
jgi:hypothetical protein